MKTIKILFFLLTLFVNTCFGQSNRFNPSNSYSDISFSGGVYNNAKDDVLGKGVIHSIDYGQFLYNGIGCRGGNKSYNQQSSFDRVSIDNRFIPLLCKDSEILGGKVWKGCAF